MKQVNYRWGQREAARKMNHNGANTKVYIRQIKSKRLKFLSLCFMKPNAKKQVILTKKQSRCTLPLPAPT